MTTNANFVPIRQAAAEAGYSYRYVRALIAAGLVRAIETTDHPDRRVRLLVSRRGLKAHRRAQKASS